MVALDTRSVHCERVKSLLERFFGAFVGDSDHPRTIPDQSAKIDFLTSGTPVTPTGYQWVHTVYTHVDQHIPAGSEYLCLGHQKGVKTVPNKKLEHELGVSNPPKTTKTRRAGFSGF